MVRHKNVQIHESMNTVYGLKLHKHYNFAISNVRADNKNLQRREYHSHVVADVQVC